MWKVEYWDGTSDPTLFKLQDEAIKAAHKGLHDWMNPGDYIAQTLIGTHLWVVGDDTGATDAYARIFYMP